MFKCYVRPRRSHCAGWGPGTGRVAGKLDIDVDEGWFSAELTAAPAPVSPEEAAPVRLPDTLGGQMPEADWARVVETLRSYEREVAALVNPRRRAALCYEIGRIYETRLGDDRRAVSAYQRAHRADGCVELGFGAGDVEVATLPDEGGEAGGLEDEDQDDEFRAQRQGGEGAKRSGHQLVVVGARKAARPDRGPARAIA